MDTKIDSTHIHLAEDFYGIRREEEFYTPPSFSKLEKIKNFILLFFRELNYAMRVLPKKIFPFFFKNKFHNLTSEKTNQQALVVFFHGLNVKPSIWNSHIDEFDKFSKKFPDFSVEIFAPNVPKRGGHCHFEDQKMMLLYEQIGKWADKNPGKPIVFFAHSNGVRPALFAESWLRDRAPRSPVFLSLKGGVFFGTAKINFLAKNLSPKLLEILTLNNLSKPACDELSFGSSSSKELLNRARQPLKNHVAKRYYRKYCAEYDVIVPEKGSCLPTFNAGGNQKNKKEKDFVTIGHGHHSILLSDIQEEVEKCFHWINKQNGIPNSKERFQFNKNTQLNINHHIGLVEVEDQRLLSAKIKAVTKTVFYNIKMAIISIKRRISEKNCPIITAKKINDSSYLYESKDLPWHSDKKSDGLYLFIHGLRGTPVVWDQYIEDIKSHDPEAHFFAPTVPLRGNCDLKTAADPLLSVVKDYLKKFPGKPIYVIGASNGGRIANYIERQLEPNALGSSLLSIVSIAGVHYGTKVVTLFKKLGLMPALMLDKKLGEEFLFGSQSAKENLTKWKEKQKIWKKGNHAVRHFYCASIGDEQVRDISCSLPYDEDAVSHYKIFHNQSHTSVVEEARQEIVQWLKSN